ncbi:hypothetical protein [Leucobacter luti]|uniref:hypothetical protein n=1 Tax=Leucobacter luti TaxID=340320 RepID=UPI003D0545F0
MSADQRRTARANGATTPILITTAIIGGVALAAVGTSAAFGAAGSLRAGSAPESTLQRVDAAGVTGVEIEASSADVSVRFGSVDEARLEVEGGGADFWELTRDESELRVTRSGGFFGGCLFWCDLGRTTVVLTLPQELEARGIEADARLSAGSLDLDGSWGEVDLDVSAGHANLDIDATKLEVEMSAGRLDGTAREVRKASFELSAGTAEFELAGAAPEQLEIGLSAGRLGLTVPDETYRLTEERSAGSLDHRLRTDPGSNRLINVEMSAGNVTLSPAD